SPGEDEEHISSGRGRVGIGIGRGPGNRRGQVGRGGRGGRDTNQNRRGRGCRGGRGGREENRNAHQHYHGPHLNRGDTIGRGDRDGHDAQRDAYRENDVPNQDSRDQNSFRDDQGSGFRKPRNRNDVNVNEYRDGRQHNREPHSNRGGQVDRGGRVGFDAQRDAHRQREEPNQDRRGQRNLRNGQDFGLMQPRSKNEVNEYQQHQRGNNQDQFRRPPDPNYSNSAPPLNASYQQYTPPPHMMPTGVYGMPAPMMSTAQGVDRKGFSRRESAASLDDQENSIGNADCTKIPVKQRKRTAKSKGKVATKKEERNVEGNDDNKEKENNDRKLADDVVSFMLSSYGCTGSPKDIQRECGLFPIDIDVDEWFRSKPQFVCIEREGKVIKVSVFIKGASYCLNYNASTGCTKDNCKRFHLCKDMLCGHCAFDKKCSLSHDALDDRNRNVTRNLRLPNCTKEDIIIILKVRLPRVCESWSEHGNCTDSTCTDLHVCPGFVDGKCKENKCTKSHDLSSTHNLPIISAYGMTEWNEMSLKRNINLQRKLQYDTNVEQDDNGETPNETERLGESAVLKGKVYESKIREAKTRRLSTLSYIHGKTKTDSFKTQWRCFWKDNASRYILFEPETLQYTIEAKFLARQKSYLYVQDNKQYRIDFEGMIHRRLNQNRPTSNGIKRRPLFVSSKDVEGKTFPPSLAVQTVNVPRPTLWMPWDHFQPFELVELQNNESDFSSVAENFYKTLDKEKQIICRIYRVQNRKLWSSFCNHEESMMMSQTDHSSALDKRNLYHGTDSDNAIRGICTNNFDFRLSGKNATRHGDGAYFASDAKYSHLYTHPPTRYMFQAVVLVGSYTQGKPEYRRPPPKPGREHELYDSCVDNMDNPRIFVAFEKTQYYPEFLIQYCDKGDHPSTTTTSNTSQDKADPLTCCLQ
ncbi:PAR11-like protein, partial [Mya arenaria]